MLASSMLLAEGHGFQPFPLAAGLGIGVGAGVLGLAEIVRRAMSLREEVDATI
ncbi:hypothetical protein [Nonomuraea endophytica]|uniref:hypothetical protein n=1 Tax=Nonomuraea endophytica TaxID=714136 RepID=UPI0037CBF4A1